MQGRSKKCHQGGAPQVYLKISFNINNILFVIYGPELEGIAAATPILVTPSSVCVFMIYHASNKTIIIILLDYFTRIILGGDYRWLKTYIINCIGNNNKISITTGRDTDTTVIKCIAANVINSELARQPSCRKLSPEACETPCQTIGYTTQEHGNLASGNNQRGRFAIQTQQVRFALIILIIKIII